MKYDYKQTYQLMRRFQSVGKIESLIIDYLIQTDIAEVTYSDIAKAIGKDTSNTQKALFNLEKRGIVVIVRKHNEDERKNKRCNPMKACYIVDGWMDTLLGE